MRKFAIAALAAVGWLALSPGISLAATADGTLLTNVASATFMSASGAGFTVSYAVTRPVLVQNPCINLVKIANPTVQASGGTVTFTLWVVNCSCTTSAFNITVTDRLPDNVEYSGNYSAWNGGSGGTDVFSSSGTLAGPYGGAPPAGQDSPYYLRFVMTQLGPCKSAFFSFTVNIL